MGAYHKHDVDFSEHLVQVQKYLSKCPQFKPLEFRKTIGGLLTYAPPQVGSPFVHDGVVYISIRWVHRAELGRWVYRLGQAGVQCYSVEDLAHHLTIYLAKKRLGVAQ